MTEQKTVACYTLGCKVNQYDSEAMLEKLVENGFAVVPFEQAADVYIINTCVVTETGEKKSRQMIRRAQKQNPFAFIVVAGCLAQRDADALIASGARLVIGNQRRGEIAALIQKAIDEDSAITAVESVKQIAFEPLVVSGHFGHTRAVMKIQEGCDRFCTYCIIPYVRGTLRSKPPLAVKAEAEGLAAAGFLELVLTGIHLTSYGRDLGGESLLDAIEAVAAVPGIRRIRLGSVEPMLIDEAFVARLSKIKKICPQFHLALQSGSNSVLRRMARRYSTEMFEKAVALLRAAFPSCAITTDIIAGFPGESEEEHAQSMRFAKKIGFSRSHVFPFSRRSGTRAYDFAGQLPKAVKEKRAKELIQIGEESAREYAKSLLFSVQEVLFEEERDGGAVGYTPQYMQVFAKGAKSGEIGKVLLNGFENDVFSSELL